MIIDQYIPRAQFSERHTIRVRATQERTFQAIREADLAASPVVKMLMALRGMTRLKKRTVGSTFSLVTVDAPRELVIGLEGSFWQPFCAVQPVTAATYGTTRPPNTALAAWNFTVTPEGDACEVATETRVVCSDAAARRKFRIYWTFIRPFSGLIRRFMLRTIRAEAERA
ncbi:MAG TPA: hypothetical protein VFN10_14475 [Thermoanaerobaculia bacterium]|nr:hypothetical protein [Thermoanaerobaculia bacterium]